MNSHNDSREHRAKGTAMQQPNRFDQLYDLALEGDEASIHGLWSECGFDFHKHDPALVRRQGGIR